MPDKRKEIEKYAVPVNSSGERVILDFVDKELFMSRAYRHEICDGRVILQQVTELQSVLHCRKCNLRAEIPTALHTLMDIAAWSESAFEHQITKVGCRYCESAPSNEGCPVCHLPPEK